jgi:hypothetical protein
MILVYPQELILMILICECEGIIKTNCLIKDVANTYTHGYVGHNI